MRSRAAHGTGWTTRCAGIAAANRSTRRKVALRAAAREVLGAVRGGAPEESTGGGTSDARFIAPLGAQCIEIGPVNASIHKVDEHVAVADLEALPDLYLALIERMLLR